MATTEERNTFGEHIAELPERIDLFSDPAETRETIGDIVVEHREEIEDLVQMGLMVGVEHIGPYTVGIAPGVPQVQGATELLVNNLAESELVDSQKAAARLHEERERLLHRHASELHEARQARQRWIIIPISDYRAKIKAALPLQLEIRSTEAAAPDARVDVAQQDQGAFGNAFPLAA